MARYDQFCALARAAEIVGERWTLLVVRELLLGPKRFTDLRGRLHGISTSILSERLSRLEGAGLVRRSFLEPPAASTVYELTEDGRALQPVVFELIRWGARYLLPSRPGDRQEPDWLRLALAAYARKDETPARSFQLRVRGGEREAIIRITGGPGGTSVTADRAPADVSVLADIEAVLGLMSGHINPAEALNAGLIGAEGDLTALPVFPELFDAAAGEETEM